MTESVSLLAAKREFRERVADCIVLIRENGHQVSEDLLTRLVYKAFPELLTRLGGELLRSIAKTGFDFDEHVDDPALLSEFNDATQRCLDEVAARGSFYSHEVEQLVITQHADLLSRMVSNVIAGLVRVNINEEVQRIAREVNVSPAILGELGGRESDWQYPGPKE